MLGVGAGVGVGEGTLLGVGDGVGVGVDRGGVAGLGTCRPWSKSTMTYSTFFVVSTKANLLPLLLAINPK